LGLRGRSDKEKVKSNKEKDQRIKMKSDLGERNHERFLLGLNLIILIRGYLQRFFSMERNPGQAGIALQSKRNH